MVHLDASEPVLGRILKALREEAIAPWVATIEEGKLRGQVASDIDARLLAQMLLAPTMVRLHRFGEDVGDRTLATIVRIALSGAGVERVPASRMTRPK